MRRRDFLAIASGAAFSVAIDARPSSAHADDGDRVAVVIGVDHVGNLPILNAAASGAQQVAGWLKAQGFEVKELTDKAGPVAVQEVWAAVAGFVNRGTVTQMVMYFAGHGVVRGYSELWLLSGAPENPNEAILLDESVDLAGQAGIENVTFISDACRSTADSLGTSRVHGNIVFPNKRSHPEVDSRVDRFFATQIGDPAWEVAVTDSSKAYRGVFTESFLGAFQTPTPDMVVRTHNIDVVPNRRLNGFLRDDVPRRARAASVSLRQLPKCMILSDEPTYVGRVASAGTSATPPAPPTNSGSQTLNDVATVAVAKALGRMPAEIAPQFAAVARSSGFGEVQARVRVPPSPPEFDATMGFTVTGASVRSALTIAGTKADVLRPGEGASPGLVRVVPELPQASVALVFGDGSGTVLASIRDFIGHVAVDAYGVATVSYVPVRSSARYPGFQARRERFDELRAAVAASAQVGAFDVSSPDFVDQIRISDGIDPTLGLYAAYAFYESGRRGPVATIYDAMRSDLKSELFDIALLADRIASEPRDPGRLVPFCPMFSRGWNLLRVKAVALPPAFEAARASLRPSLWTAFGSAGMDSILGSDIWR